MQEKYWNYMVQIKAWIFYLDLYIEDSYKWERRFNIFSAIASSASIAAWTMWDQFSFLWALVIAVSQVINAVKEFLPFSKRIKFIMPLLQNLKFLYNKMEYNWFGVASGEMTEEEMNKLLYRFKDEFSNIENVGLKEEILTERKDFMHLADKRTTSYFMNHF